MKAMNTEQVKRAFRASGVKLSGYGLKRFLRKLSERLPEDHKGHRIQAMVRTLKGLSEYRCSCGQSILVESTNAPKSA